jgi:hypothetical protein
MRDLSEQASKWVCENEPRAFDDTDLFYELMQAKFAELIVKMCANAADMAYDARCEYVGDYVGEYMGYGVEEGIATWRLA